MRPLLITTAVLAAVLAAHAQTPAARQLHVVGHSDLNGHGNGGEGLDLQQYPDGRRILFYAHTAPPAGVTSIDVADPANPRQLAYFDTSGGPSRGAHYVWFADDRYA